MITDTSLATKLIGGEPRQARPLGDFYPTPPIAVEKLLSVETFNNAIWEPACGDGAISKVLTSKGFDVLSTDLHDWGYSTQTGPQWDFLALRDNTERDIITNPPFNISCPFVENALALTKEKGGKVAILEKLIFLSSKKRQRLFKEFPFKKAYIFSKRLPRMHRTDYDGKKVSSMIDFAWYVWDWKYVGNPEIDFLS